MEINLICPKCKEQITVTPFVYAHTIITNQDLIEHRNSYEAHICLKATCYHCGDLVYHHIKQDITNSDIERICYGTKKEHN